LHQHPGLRIARPPLPGRAVPGGLRAMLPRREQNTPHRRARDDDALPLGQQLAQVLVVTAAIRGAGQLENPPTAGLGHGMGRLTPTIAVGRRRRTALPIPLDEPPDLTHRQPQQFRRRRG